MATKVEIRHGEVTFEKLPIGSAFIDEDGFRAVKVGVKEARMLTNADDELLNWQSLEYRPDAWVNAVDLTLVFSR